MTRRLSTIAAALFAVLAGTCSAELPFTHATVSGGVKVTSITDEAQNQGNIEVGDIVIRATRIKGNISRVRTSGQLQFFAQESRPAKMIFLDVIRSESGKVETRIVPLEN